MKKTNSAIEGSLIEVNDEIGIVDKTVIRRKRIIKAIIAFVVILALLTFFSNTIMNATMPEVKIQKISTGKVSQENSLQGKVEASNATEVNGIDERVVDKILKNNFETVEAGEEIILLKDIESESSALENMREQLKSKELDEQYPLNAALKEDYSSYEKAIDTAEQMLTAKQEQLNAAESKNETISEANQTISDNNRKIGSLKSELQSVQARLESLNSESSSLAIRINTAATEEERAQLVARKGEIDAEVSNNSSRMSDINSNIEELQTDIASAQQQIVQANGVPSVETAKKELSSANKDLAKAKTALEDAKKDFKNKKVHEDANKEKMKKEIEKLKEKIEKKEKDYSAKSITAPISGTIVALDIMPNAKLSEKQVIFKIVPPDVEWTVKFKYAKEASNCGLKAGDPLNVETNGYGKKTCSVSKVRPDPSAPKNMSIVECYVKGDNIQYGEEINVKADSSSEIGNTIVPAGAIHKDKTGNFIYIMEQSSTPLGDKCVAKKVSVETGITDGSKTSISTTNSEDLSNADIIVLSNKPLEDGMRVRLEDFDDKDK